MATVDFKALQAPFGDEDLEWRQQGGKTKNGTLLVLPYVTNRAIQQRLDDVCGPANWSNMYMEGPGGGVLCGLTIVVEPNRAVTKWDGAPNTQVESVKGGLSDSMKRAAVQWGMGRHLYSLPKHYVKPQKSGKYYTKDFGAWDPPLIGGPPPKPKKKNGIDERKLTPLSPQALEARKPQPPEELVGALQDRVHVDVGRARPARSVKIDRVEKALKYFEKQGVFQSELEEHLGNKAALDWTDEDVDTLKGIYGL